MIPLDSPRWSELNHAYGSAADIPALLRFAYANPYLPDDEQVRDWGELTGRIWHQGTIYSASIAAVPHLIEAGMTAKPGILAWDIVHLPVLIERSRLTQHPQIRPEEIDSDYFTAILRLKNLCAKTDQWGRDRYLARAVTAARRLLSKRRGDILPKQKSDMGPLFANDRNT